MVNYVYIVVDGGGRGAALTSTNSAFFVVMRHSQRVPGHTPHSAARLNARAADHCPNREAVRKPVSL